MKKIKKTLAVITALVTLTTCSMSISAERTYDLENEEYRNYVDTYCNEYFQYEEFFIKLLEHYFPYDHLTNIKYIYKHVYNTQTQGPLYAIYRYEYSFENYEDYCRLFHTINVHWNKYHFDDEFRANHTKEELELFLEENNLNEKIIEISDWTNIETYGFEITFADDIEISDIIPIAEALYNEYNITPTWEVLTYRSPEFYDEIPTTEDISNNVGTPTLAGDLNLDNEQGITDIVTLTKYTASPELYPITDATALANADVNQDGKIDSLDTNILIEMTLGSFESAV